MTTPETSTMKTVLIIAYDFPPSRTSGVYRPLKFAKYLPEFGWRPVILSVSNPPKRQMDPALLKELPAGTPIYRAMSIEPKRLEQFIFQTLFGKKGASQSESPQTTVSQASSKPSLMQNIKKHLLSPISRFTHEVLYTPDEHVGWVPLAVRKGWRAIENEKVDLIFSTSPPETNHLVGYRLATLTSKPWVADFRDPWIDNFIRERVSDNRKKRERELEGMVLSRADRIVNVGQRFSLLSQESFPEIAAEKHVAITNGYDEENFAGLDAEAIYKSSRTPYLNIMNVGTIYENSGFEQFLMAFEQLLRDPSYKRKLHFTHVGDLFPMWEARIKKEPIASHVTRIGFTPHQETLKLMMSADILLLMPSGGNAKTSDKIIPGKLFELMRAGRPVLLIGWPGESADIITQSGMGKFASTDSVDSISNALREFVAKKEKGELSAAPNWDFIRQYDRKALTARLAEQFDRLMKIRG